MGLKGAPTLVTAEQSPHYITTPLDTPFQGVCVRSDAATPLWHKLGVSIVTSTVRYSSSSTELLTQRCYKT